MPICERMSRNDGGSQRRTVLQGVAAMLGAGALISTASADDDDDGHDHEESEGDADEASGNDGQFCLPDQDGLITVEGGESVEETVGAIEAAIEDQEDLMLVAAVDHAENAASVGEELRPTTLLLFGNPEAGTPLMQENQTTGIDLPQKLLIWCDENNETNVTYNDPEYLAARHALEENDEIIEMVGEALAMLAEQGGEDDADDGGEHEDDE